ncbi:hypothetical protein BDZ90DRAFT_232882 [Jaminaea rosea]|uniref:DNA polymerase V n=1 Tax=Jaminaea rosea TaxID=1569628 RepID=A0A316UR33_9BASI|nr:hypothetical protein BDZ90DRAFT_232882 [Jaminaea rosea]PWN26771.1 hypothetical protein BDZ90DRAFT_232882 [Jaminaea rosea]
MPGPQPSSSSLSLFWDLASPQEEKRIASSSQLVSTLLGQQSALVATTSRSTLDGDDQPPSDADAADIEAYLDRCLASEVSYSLRRLIRGLASPRQQSRVGFAVALTELLSNLTTLVRPGHFLTLLRKYSTPSGSIDGFEQRNLLFARLFGVHSLVRSGLLLSHPQASPQEVAAAVDLLVELGETKAWMRESAAWELVEMLQAAQAEGSSSRLKDAVMSSLGAYATSSDITPEKLALMLQLPGRQHPNLKASHPLSSANLPAVAKILRNASSSLEKEAAEDAATKQDRTGAHNPRAHFVWDTILALYASGSTKGAAPFGDFWRIAVDDSLFATNATPERKSWGFQIFSRALPLLPASDKPLLLSPNFMRTWINQLAGGDRLLHKAAVQAAEVVQATVKEEPRAGFALVVQLLGKHGNQNFDKLTKTKTIEGLLGQMDGEGVDQYVHYVVESISSSHEDAKRRWGLDQLLNLVRNTAVPTSDACVESILSYLVVGGLFAWKKPPAKGLLALQPKPAFSDEIRGLCRSRWLSCLTDLMDRTTALGTEEGKTRRVQGVDSKGVPWLRNAWNGLQTISKDSKSFSSSLEDETVKEAVANGEKLLIKVHKSKKERSEAFETLVIATLLYIYEAGPEDANDLITQLTDCHERLSAPATAVAKRNDEEEEEISGIELLLDYLVGLLERPSAFLRAVTEHVFAAYVPDMNRGSVEHLVDQLGLNEEPEGAEGEDDEDDEMEDREEAGETSEATSSDSDDEDEDDEDDDEEVDEDLRNAVSEVLKAAGMADEDEDEDAADPDAEGVDKDVARPQVNGDDSDNESVPDLTDDQMMQIDDQLGDIFRARLQSRKETKEAKAESVAFQHKVLDLLAIFAKRRSSSAEVLVLARPLFVLASEGDDIDRSLATKAGTVLRSSICKAKEMPQVDEDGLEGVLEDLEAVHGLARRTTSGDLASLASVVNLYLTRICLGEAGDELNAKLIRLYEETLKDFLTRSASQLKPSFLLDALKRFPRLGWQLRSVLLEGCSLSASIKAFRQQQAFQMLLAVLNQAAGAVELKEQVVTKAMPEVATVVFSSIAFATASHSTSSEGGASAGKVKELLKFALQAVRLTQRVSATTSSPEAVRSVWKPTKIRDALETMGQSEQFKQSTSLQGLLKQMLALVEGGSASNGAAKGKKNKDRRNSVSEANGVEEGAVKSKKQKVNGDAAKALQGKKKQKKKGQAAA